MCGFKIKLTVLKKDELKSLLNIRKDFSFLIVDEVSLVQKGDTFEWRS